MFNDFKNLKTASIILMLMLMVLGFQHWNLRAIYADSAFMNFRFLQEENFIIVHNRVGEYITQILPVMAAKYTSSAKLVMQLWVFNVLGYIFLCFMLMIRRSEGLVPALVFLLVYATGLQRMFYDNSSQLISGMATILLAYSYLPKFFDIKNKKVVIESIVTVLLFVLGLLFHKGLMPIILFLLFFYAYKNSFLKQSLFLVGSIFILVFGFLKFLPASSYEGEFLSNLNLDTIKNTNFLKYPIISFINDRLKTLYFPFVLIFLLGVYSYVKKGAWHLFLYIAPAFAILFLYALIFSEPEGTMMMEKKAWPVLIAFILPVVYYVVQSKIPSLRIVFSVLLVVFVWKGVKNIKNTAPLYANRQKEMVKLMEREDIKRDQKVIIDGYDLAENTFLIRWAVPYESLLLSTLHSPEHLITIKNAVDESFDEINNDKTYMIGPHYNVYAKFNPKFFKLKQGKYTAVDISEK